MIKWTNRFDGVANASNEREAVFKKWDDDARAVFKDATREQLLEIVVDMYGAIEQAQDLVRASGDEELLQHVLDCFDLDFGIYLK